MDSALIGVLAGLGAMAGWGLSDFFAAKSSKETAPVQTLFISWLLGIFLFTPFAILNFDAVSLSPSLLLKILLYSFNFALGNALFYKALEIGPVSIISPLSSSYPLVAVLVAVLVFGEVLLGPQYLAIALIIFGSVLASLHFERFPIHMEKKNGILYTLFAVLLWGTAIPISSQVIGEIGWFFTLFFQLVFGTLWLYLLYGLRGGVKAVWGSGFTWIIAAVALSYLLAVTSFNLGLEKSLVSIVTPVSAIYPLVTVALALALMKEKVFKIQLLGAGLIIGGIVLLSIG